MHHAGRALCAGSAQRSQPICRYAGPPRGVRRAVSALCSVVCLLVLAVIARADDLPPPVEAVPTEPAMAPPAVAPEVIELPEDPELDDPEGWIEQPDGTVLLETDDTGEVYRVPVDCDPWESGELQWVDRAHHAFSRGLCWPTQWLDGVFGDADDQSRGVAGTSVRVVGAQLFRDDGERDSDVRFRVRVHLPNLEHRLSLVLASEREFEDENAGLQGSPETTGDNEDNAARAGLRWVLATADNMDIDMDVGVRSDIKLYWRGRYRQQRQVSEYWSARLEETVDWRDLKGWRSRTVVDFDRPLSRHRLFRSTSFVEISEENIQEGRGWRWQQSAVLGVELNRREALRYLVSMDGFTRPNTRVENYRAGVTYRRNIWRPWFFYELEPYLLWPRERDFDTTTGIVFRVETLFGIW